MYSLSAQNQYGEKLELTHNTAYSIIEIDGLDPPDAAINTARNAGYDGSVFNSAYMKERPITITMAINSPAEANRIALYRYFKSKFPVRIFYKNGQRDVYIDGFVRSMQIAYYAKKQTVQIVILCPRPHLNGIEVQTQNFYTVNSLFEFEFSIEEGDPIAFSEIVTGEERSILNSGDIETGVLIRIEATGTVDTPKIYNVDTSESMIFDLTMGEGDLITINTRQGEKSVKLLHDGVTTNIIGQMRQGSSWFTLKPGDNLFTIDADDQTSVNMMVSFEVIDQYEGV